MPPARREAIPWYIPSFGIYLHKRDSENLSAIDLKIQQVNHIRRVSTVRGGSDQRCHHCRASFRETLHETDNPNEIKRRWKTRQGQATPRK